MKNENNETNKYAIDNKYKTFRGIDSQHKVKYQNIDNISNYEDIISELRSPNYNSVFAEKRRTWQKRKKIKIFDDDKKFIDKINELYLTVLKSLIDDIDSLDKITKQYYFSKKLNTILKINYLKNENNLFVEFMMTDIIYQDEFIVNKLPNGKWMLKFTKKMITPIPIEMVSQIGAFTKWYLSKEWKIYSKSIIKGIKWG